MKVKLHFFYAALIILATALVLPLFSQPVPSGKTYYVATTGSDSAAGTSGAPFKTIQQGVSILKPGDTLNVKAGNYAGFICGWDSSGLYGPISGTAAAPITIQADPAAAVGSVKITSRDNKTEDGIDFEPANGPQNYIVIKGFNLACDSSIASHAVRIGGSPTTSDVGVQVLNCTVTNAGQFGIFSSFTTDLLMQGNTVSNTKGSGSTGHGIYISNSALRPVARGNTIFGNGSEGIHVNGDASQGGTGIITGAIIEGNVIHDNAANGINCDGASNSTFQNNLLYGNAKHGICLYKIDAALDSSNNLICDNTIVQPNSVGAAIEIVNASTGNVIFNNVLTGGTYGAINLSTASMPGLVSDYNAVSDLFCNDDSSAHYSLAQWQTNFKHDQHSFVGTATALFVATTDFHLKTGSTAIGKGIASLGGKSAPAFDITGGTRTTFDIGAYAAVPGPPATNPTTIPTTQPIGTPGNPRADVNGDGIVDINDMTIIVNNWQAKRNPDGTYTKPAATQP